MEQAIKKAIEGGYVISFELEHEYKKSGSFARGFLDPLFWQALGKAEGWVFCNCGGDEEGKCLYRGESWIYHWHRFIDHLANGGKPDEFFEKLLSNE